MQQRLGAFDIFMRKRQNVVVHQTEKLLGAWDSSFIFRVLDGVTNRTVAMDFHQLVNGSHGWRIA